MVRKSKEADAAYMRKYRKLQKENLKFVKKQLADAKRDLKEWQKLRALVARSYKNFLVIRKRYEENIESRDDVIQKLLKIIETLEKEAKKK